MLFVGQAAKLSTQLRLMIKANWLHPYYVMLHRCEAVVVPSQGVQESLHLCQ